MKTTLEIIDERIATLNRVLEPLCEKQSRTKREQRQVDQGLEQLGKLKTLRVRYLLHRRYANECKAASHGLLNAAQHQQNLAALEHHQQAMAAIEQEVVS